MLHKNLYTFEASGDWESDIKHFFRIQPLGN